MVALPRNFTADTPDRLAPHAPASARLAHHAPAVSALMRALGHSGRLLLLAHLRDGPRTVSELQVLLDAPQPVVSSHLARLRREGLVRFERVGKCSLYALQPGPAREVLDHLCTTFCDRLAAQDPTAPQIERTVA